MANPVIRDTGLSSFQSAFEASTTPYHEIGTVATLRERSFVYTSYQGGSELALGTLCAVQDPDEQHQSVAYSSGGEADTNTVTVTLGSNAVTENQYRDGYLVVIDGGTGAGQGQLRKIRSHPAASATATLEITVYDDFDTSITGGELSIVANEYDSIVAHPGMAGTDGNLIPVGVNPVDVPDGSTDLQYFWMQTGGPALVLGDGSAFTAGAPVGPASATADAGQVTLVTETGASGTRTLIPIVGYLINLGDATSDGDHRFVHLILKH